MLGIGVSLTSSLFTRTGGGTAQPAPDVAVLTLSAPGGTTAFAPAGFMLDVDHYGALHTFPRRSIFDYHHVWSFGDADAGDFEAVSLPSPFLTGRNSMTGPVAAHVYENAGTFTATCSLYNKLGQLVGRGSIDLTVVDQDAHFGAANTIVFSTAGNFAGAPDAAHQISDVGELKTLMTSWRNRDRARVLFRRGETIMLDAGGSGALELTGNANGGLYGAFGDPSDPRPIFQMNGGSQTTISPCLVGGINGSGSRYVFTELEVDGRYDPVTPIQPAGTKPLNAFTIGGVHGLAHKCKAINTNVGFYPVNNEHTDECIISDCTVDGWSDYGSLAFTIRSAYIGCSVKQNPNVAYGDPTEGKGFDRGFHADHGPVRCSGRSPFPGPRHWHVSYANDLFSRGGWSANSGGTTAHQPCLRLLGDGNSFFKINVANNRMEGGKEVLSLSTHGPADMFRGYALVEANYLIGDEQTDNFTRASRHGVEIRSNVMVKPDVPQDQSTLNRFFTWSHPGANPDDGHAWPVKFYNNTCINLQSAANAGPFDISVHTTEGGPPAVFVVGDNLIQADGAPNAADLIDHSPLDPAEFFRPLAGSTALGASMLGLAPTDFARGYRHGATAIGAWRDKA